MVDLTLFEIHLDGAEFTANAPGSGVGRSGSADEEEPKDGGGVSPLPILLAVGLLVVVAVVYRRLSGGSDESFEE